MTPMEMARKAVNYLPETDYEPILHTKEQIDRFAEIVRNEVYKDDVMTDAYMAGFAAGRDTGKTEEREACAKVCEETIKRNSEAMFSWEIVEPAAAIRARGIK